MMGSVTKRPTAARDVTSADIAALATAGSGPKILIIRLLEACDAGCFMCDFAFSNDNHRFSIAEACDIANEVRGGSLRLVRFTGGEPLLHRDLPEIVATFEQAGLLTSVITNGGLLADRLGGLLDAGIAQVIVSLDAPQARSHDRFRRNPGLFDRAVAGLKELRRLAPQVRTRVNTVAGPHNVEQLEEMYDLLGALGIDDWSIIPLKAEGQAWRFPKPSKARSAYRRFVERVSGRPGPRLIGFSLHWMGRTEAEVGAYLDAGRPMTPRGQCGLVDLVRYYTPANGLTYPCNCVPHRSSGRSFAEAWSSDLLSGRSGNAGVTWLRKNGPSHCRGCEPANVALGEGIEDIEADPFIF
jgi:cytosylglucuronate decarboxylase